MSRGAFSLRAAAHQPEHAATNALVTATGAFTYADLWRLTATVVQELGAQPPGRSVAVVAPLRLETLLAIYALVELRVPLVPIHPRLVPREREALVDLAGASRLLDERWVPSVQPPAGDLPPGRSDDEEDPLAILFTSGSSGAPKGVELSHRAFAAAAKASAENLGWHTNDRWLLCMPLGHVGGLSIVLRCLAARATIVMSPWTGSIEALLKDIEHLDVTILSLVPTMLARILADAPTYRFPPRVRAVLLGGDAASPSLLAAAAARGVPVLTTYGMTEACSQIATSAPGEPASAAMGVGRPLPGVEVRIVDGEIHARGPVLFTRYVPPAPARTSADGWFGTGDLGRFDEQGRLHVTGRRSDLIITGGENVDPREVEAALETCAGVAAAAVFGVPDERWGQVVGAAVVLTPGANAHRVGAVVSELKTKLAPHKWPRRIAVVDALVFNATGKLDRKSTAAVATPALAAIA